jgi:hypothetical protein
MLRRRRAPTSPVRSTNYGIRLYQHQAINRAANTSAWVNASATAGGYMTSHVCIDAESDFDAVQLIFANASGVSRTISGISVAAGATLGDLTNSSAAGRASFVQGKFAGADSADLAGR